MEQAGLSTRSNTKGLQAVKNARQKLNLYNNDVERLTLKFLGLYFDHTQPQVLTHHYPAV